MVAKRLSLIALAVTLSLVLIARVTEAKSQISKQVDLSNDPARWRDEIGQGFAEPQWTAWYGAPPRTRLIAPLSDYSQTLDIYRDGLGTGWADWSWNATVDLAASNPVYSGTRAISVTAQAYGTLSLHHASFDTTPYFWLEFYVRGSVVNQQLYAYANDEQDTELRYLPVCRYCDGGAIGPVTWQRVRIPLSDLDAARRRIQRVSIKNYTDHISTFWVDEVRLVAATWRVYLPLVIRASQ